MGLLRFLESTPGVIKRLGRNLMPCKMIFLAMMRGGNPMGMRGFIVHFGGYAVKVCRH